MLTDNEKEEIDNMSYEGMLKIERFSVAVYYKHSIEACEYFYKKMKEKRRELSLIDIEIINKKVGWKKRTREDLR